MKLPTCNHKSHIMIHTLCVGYVRPASWCPGDLDYRYRPGFGSYVSPRVRSTEDTAYTYYDGLGMIAHNGYLFKLENPYKFHHAHSAQTTYEDDSSSENFTVWSRTARRFLKTYSTSEDDMWEDLVDYIDNKLVLTSGVERTTTFRMHWASASKATKIGTLWDGKPKIVYVSLTMAALRCIQRFLRPRLARLLARSKFVAFLIYGSRQTGTLQRVDADVLKVIMKLAAS